MKISSSLLKPHIEQIEKEFENLTSHLAFKSSDEATELRSHVERELQELQQLTASLTSLDQTQEGRVPVNLYESFKKAKRSLRFSKRTWFRFLSNESRIRKIKEKRAHVTSVAA